ncbi:MAG: putative cytochrome assembly protein [Frankiales bacterium]|nr:putative cytochrome assembly protein [Frankiales bacterium]
MPDKGLGHVGDVLLLVAVVIYALAMLGYAAEQAGRRARRSVATPERVLVGSGGPDIEQLPQEPPPPPPSSAGRLALVLTGIGWVIHVISLVLRGFAAHRVPWGNMYEFSSAVALVAVTGFLLLVLRGKVERALGAFIMLPVVLYLGLASSVLYTEAGPLVPALNSYWIKIHVAAAITASGAFMLSGVVAVLYLIRTRYDDLEASGAPVRFPISLGAQLPLAPVLDRVSYSVIAFAFPVWTFAVIAGAIWAESAWGRYWGWDPKETWSFITWVLYAGYLHARATAGWKGRRAAWVAVAAAIALIIDYYVVNIFVVGLHSYA